MSNYPDDCGAGNNNVPWADTGWEEVKPKICPDCDSKIRVERTNNGTDFYCTECDYYDYEVHSEYI